MNTHQKAITTALDDMSAQIRRMEQRTPGVQYSFGDLWAKEMAARKAVAAMAAELEAIGAGGVEQLRKPGCLAQIQDPCQHMQELRAYELTVSNLRAQVAALEANAPQAVQLSESRNQRVYVAGPMTGMPDYNFPAFNAAASMLRAKGWHVENPAEHGIVAGATWADYMHYDLARIATCSAIYLLPGWCQSRGAALEVHIASVLGMAFQYADGAERYHPPSATQPAAQWMEQDAARYQAIVESGNFAPSPFDNGMWGLRASSAPSTKAELDAAVDRVIAAQAKQGGASHG